LLTSDNLLKSYQWQLSWNPQHLTSFHQIVTIEVVPFVEKYETRAQCILYREELSCHCESHACQPANSSLPVPITTYVADAQPPQNNGSKNQQSCQGKGVQNMHPSCL